jgi:hypothetical protein
MKSRIEVADSRSSYPSPGSYNYAGDQLGKTGQSSTIKSRIETKPSNADVPSPGNSIQIEHQYCY